MTRTDCVAWVTAPLTMVPHVTMALDHPERYPVFGVSGIVEVESYQTDTDLGGDENDTAIATGALGLGVAVNKWLSAEISTLYEQNETPLEIDTASVTLGHQDSSWSLRAGQFYVPFGRYETAMISDPLTLELGETREMAIRLGIAHGDFIAEAYAFNGEFGEKDQINSFGVSVGYLATLGAAELALSAGYLNDFSESDSIEETIRDAIGAGESDAVDAWTASAVVDLGDVTLVGEYLAATDAFETAEIPYRGGGARPVAWNVEASYDFRLLGRAASAGVGYQGTGGSVALGLPNRRILTALSVDVLPRTALSVEYAHDNDYEAADGGSGKTASTFLTQLAVAF